MYKKKYVILIVIMIILTIFSINIYKNYETYSVRYTLKSCKNGYFLKRVDELCEKKKGNYCENVEEKKEGYKRICNNVIEESKKYKHPTEDTNTYMYLITSHTICGLPYIYLVIILYSSQSKNQSLANGNYLKNASTRMNYKKYLKQQIFESYKSTIIFPLMVLFLYLWAYHYSGHFDTLYVEDILKTTPIATYNLAYLQMGIKLLPYLMLITQIYAMIYANIGTISLYKSKNIIQTVITATLIFLGANLLIEIIAMGIFSFKNIKIITFEKYNFLNPFLLVDNKVVNIVKPIIYYIVTTIIIIIMYSKKEKRMMELEKNDART